MNKKRKKKPTTPRPLARAAWERSGAGIHTDLKADPTRKAKDDWNSQDLD